MVTVVSIASRRGFTIEACHGNLPKKTKLPMYKLLLSLKSHLKQLYISSNKTEHFGYKSGCSIHVSRCL